MVRLGLKQCFAGFTNRAESEYDPFGAGHSSTSVSAALGMAVGRDFKVRRLLQPAYLLGECYEAVMAGKSLLNRALLQVIPKKPPMARKDCERV